MVDNVEALKLAENETNRLIDVMHRSGLNYWQILRIFLIACQTLQMMADAEFWIKQRS